MFGEGDAPPGGRLELESAPLSNGLDCDPQVGMPVTLPAPG